MFESQHGSFTASTASLLQLAQRSFGGMLSTVSELCRVSTAQSYTAMSKYTLGKLKGSGAKRSHVGWDGRSSVSEGAWRKVRSSRHSACEGRRSRVGRRHARF